MLSRYEAFDVRNFQTLVKFVKASTNLVDITVAIRWKIFIPRNSNTPLGHFGFFPSSLKKANQSNIKPSTFYFRATSGVKEVLQSSENSTSIFLWFFVLHHSHSLKMCFRKNVYVCMCVCVCVCLSLCLSVWPSPIVEPKPVDRSGWNSISRVLL